MAERSLTFVSTPLGLVAGLLLVLVTAGLAFIAWRRSGWRRSTGLLEGLRVVIAALIALTLNQPELLEEYRPQERPTLAVLWDASRSMETRDVIGSDQPGAAAISRRQWIQPLLENEFWQPVAEKLEVVIEPFSSSLATPAEGTDLSAALRGALERHRNLRGVVLFTDGDWNTGDPPARAALQLRPKRIPVYAVGVGSASRLPDVELVRVDAPTFGAVGKSLRIPVIVDSALPRDYDTSIVLEVLGGEQVTKQVRIPAMGRLEDALTWTPQETGDFLLTVSIPPHPDELVDDNNERSVPISIRQETLKVLLVESHPRWEYRYLRNALERDPGVEVSCLLFHPGLSKVGGGSGYIESFPGTMEELARYDVVFLGDVGIGPGQLTPQQCELIKGLVQSQASGLILMPGLRGAQLSLTGTALDELFPVVLDAAQPRGWGSRVPAQFELTESGRRSLLTKLEEQEAENARLWETLPGFQWYAPVLRAKAGSQVLASHRTETNRYGRIPLLVTKTYGTGKVLFMGSDGAWRWREGVEDLYHYRFWGQVARWMAYQRNMAQGELMRLFYAPDRPEAGDMVTLNANVMSLGGEPLEDGTVVVQVVAPSGKTESVRLIPQGDQWGLFTGTFTPQEDGQYELALTCRENQSTLETTLSVYGGRRERLGHPVRLDVLEEIVMLTEGQLVEGQELESMLNEIADLPEPEPLVRRLRLWCHPLWAGGVVLLLGVFWTGRKLSGAI